MKIVLKSFISLSVLLLFYGCNENINYYEPKIATTYANINCSTLDTNRTNIECGQLSIEEFIKNPNNFVGLSCVDDENPIKFL